MVGHIVATRANGAVDSRRQVMLARWFTATIIGSRPKWLKLVETAELRAVMLILEVLKRRPKVAISEDGTSKTPMSREEMKLVGTSILDSSL